MGSPLEPSIGVRDATRALIGAAERLRAARAEADCAVAAIEARWAANRAARTR